MNISFFTKNKFFLRPSRKRLQVWAIKCGQCKTETVDCCFDHANENVISLVSLFFNPENNNQHSVDSQKMRSRAIKPTSKTTPNWVHFFSKSINSVL